MEDSLRARVVGQDHVVSAISNAVRISRAGLQAPTRPVASFLFLGPTGVGKVSAIRCTSSSLSHQDLLDRIVQGVGWILVQRRAPGTVRPHYLRHPDRYLDVDYRININMSEVSTSGLDWSIWF